MRRKNRKMGLLLKKYFLGIGLVLCWSDVLPQQMDFRGQASAWTTLKSIELNDTQIGLRYIPELSIQKTISRGYSLDAEVSFNAYGSGLFHCLDDVEKDGRIKPYRIWLRFSSSRFEARIGLQKINFGSASLLRPLMWYDRIDPRDPLQITDGVYGLLLRYYFLNNANIWLWGLYGNDETKGWEFIPSDEKSVEVGGRVQYPVPKGEVAVSYHHRRIDVQRGIDQLLALAGMPDLDGSVISNFIDLENIDEDRFGFDGRWDVEIGLWVETVLIHQDIDWIPYKYQRLMNIGLDYTFALGNGVHSMYEHFWFTIAEDAFGRGEEMEFSALSLNYPIGLLDNLTGMIYYDWENEDWYRFVSWQRTYDRWRIYLMGFWNPAEFQIYQNLTEQNLFSGKGFQLMVVFNH
jgi:hypothetical protein